MYRSGLFTKQYFVEHGEGCCADIFYALSEEIERLNAARAEIGEAPFRRPNYSSFAKYFHWFKVLGLVEPTDRREPAIKVELVHIKNGLIFDYRITSKRSHDFGERNGIEQKSLLFNYTTERHKVESSKGAVVFEQALAKRRG